MTARAAGAATDRPPLADRDAGDRLAALDLRLVRALSDDGGPFVTLLCRDRRDAAVVLKHVPDGSAQACRRLSLESRLLSGLRPRPPLALPALLAAGHGFQVTAFEPGRLLRASVLEADPAIVDAIAAALAEFQQCAPRVRALGIRDRSSVPPFLAKAFARSAIHAWPDVLSANDVARAGAVLARSTRAILAEAVPSHGDFLPTNLLFDAERQLITFTDLEAFRAANHPLFDVLALCTITDRPLDEWPWQRRFLQSYLRCAAGTSGIDAGAPRFRQAYRGLLVFWLFDRVNDAHLLSRGQVSFGGRSKARFVWRKAAGLGAAAEPVPDPSMASTIAAHVANLRRALDDAAFAAHFALMTDPS